MSEARSQVVIASRLSDGLVVFLGPETGGTACWVLRLEDACRADSPEAAAELEAAGQRAAERHEVVDPYLIEVEERDGRLRPTRFREAIRALGPTVRSDLGKQAEQRVDGV